MIYLKGAFVAGWLVISCLIVVCLTPLALLGADLNWLMAKINARITLFVTGVTVEEVGPERLDASESCVIMGNHQSMFDFPICARVFAGRCSVIGKKELLWIPFFNAFFVLAGNIVLNRQKRGQSIQALDEAAEKVKRKKVSVWIFPEGTRNRQMEGLLPFKKGPFYLALKAGVPIRPMLISSLKPILDIEGRKFNRGKIQVQVLPLISTQGLNPQKKEDVDKLSHQVREIMLAALAKMETKACD